MKRKRILFSGYYGFNNFGDDLFAATCEKNASTLRNGYEAIILSPPIDGVEANYLVPQELSDTYKSRNLAGKSVRLLYMLYGLLTCKEFVLSGGSLVTSDVSFFSARKFQRFFSKIGLINLSAIGISVGPFSSKNDEREAKLFLNELKYLSVRDSASLSECNRLGISIKPNLYYDLAGSAYLPVKCSKNKTKKTLGVSVCRYESILGAPGNEIQRNRAIFESIKNFSLQNDIDVDILTLNSDEEIGDLEISTSLHSYLTENGVSARIINYLNPDETLKEIAGCDMFFSIRLHGAISAYLLEIPFILVEYHKKCTDFLDEIGFDNECRVKDHTRDTAHIVKCLESLLNDNKQHKLSASIYKEKSRDAFLESPWNKKNNSI